MGQLCFSCQLRLVEGVDCKQEMQSATEVALSSRGSIF